MHKSVKNLLLKGRLTVILQGKYLKMYMVSGGKIMDF